MFLNLLREQLCDHPDSSFHVQSDGDRTLRCRECSCRLSLRTYLRRTVSPYKSPANAEAYVEWSGDSKVPCRFESVRLRYRALTTEIHTTYATLFKAHVLLSILHVPFAQKDEVYSNEPTPAGIRFFRETVLSTLDHLVNRVWHERDDFAGRSVGSLAHGVLACLRNLFAAESTRYFDVLVPYVKRVRPLDEEPFENFHEKRPMHLAIDNRLIESHFLHRRYARSCPAFDVVHVATLCFLCQDDLGAVCDLVLDFAGNVCAGYYDDGAFPLFGRPLPDDPLVRDLTDVLRERVSPEINTRLYRVLELFRLGGPDMADHFSDALFAAYRELKLALLEKRPADAHFEWVFPRILFRDYSDYYAFLAALDYYCSETTPGSETSAGVTGGSSSPRVVSKCKAVYRFVKKSVAKVKVFHECMVESQLQRTQLKSMRSGAPKLLSEEEKPLSKGYFWSRDLLKRFLDNHPEFERECVQATSWLTRLPLVRGKDPASLAETGTPERAASVVPTQCQFESLFRLAPGEPVPFETVYRAYVKTARR